jgi:hypothetical protein
MTDFSIDNTIRSRITYTENATADAVLQAFWANVLEQAAEQAESIRANFETVKNGNEVHVHFPWTGRGG